METKKKKRMSAKKVKEAIAFCINRDGRRCNVCKIFQSESQLLLDHKDNNAENNPRDGSNWQVVCRRHNYLKNPRGNRKHNISDSSIIDRPRETSAEMLKNSQAEPTFRRWLYDYLRAKSRIEEQTAINMGAEIARCSPITTRRYLVKCCSDAGFAFISYDSTAECNFIYLRTKVMQPISIEPMEGHAI